MGFTLSKMLEKKDKQYYKKHITSKQWGSSGYKTRRVSCVFAHGLEIHE